MDEYEPGSLGQLLRARRHIGTVALALAVAMAAIAVVAFQAWTALAPLGLVLILVVVLRWPLDRADAVRVALGFVGSLVLGAVGLVLVFVGGFHSVLPCGPDPACPARGPDLIPLAGLTMMIVALVGLALTARFAAHRRLGER